MCYNDSEDRKEGGEMNRDATLKAILDKPQPVTVRDFIEGKTADQEVFIETWRGAEKVTGYRLLPDPWVICGEANAGFGISYRVGYETRLVTK